MSDVREMDHNRILVSEKKRHEDLISLGYNCDLDVFHEVLIKDMLTISLSRIQFRLLYCLAESMGQPVFSEDLIRYIWGPKSLVSKEELYVYINRIRNRLEDNVRRPQQLLSLRNMGYVLFPRKNARNKK